MKVEFLYGWGYLLKAKNGKLSIKLSSGEKPIDDCSCVELDGEGALAINALRETIRRGLRVSVKSRHGRAIIDPKPLTVHQIAKFLNDDLRLKVSKLIVQAASINKLYVLRLVGLKSSNEYSKINGLMEGIDKATTIWGLMAIEAEITKTYYEALRQVIPLEYEFTARSRRPPRDPVSASLSYLNMQLYSICVRALRYHGLDERIGFLHEPRGNRASLALDLAEEFRQPLVDAAVIPAFTSRSMRKSDFTYSINGVFLNNRGRRKMLKLFRHRLNLTTPKGKFEELIYAQASKLADWISGSRGYYEPFILTLEV